MATDEELEEELGEEESDVDVEGFRLLHSPESSVKKHEDRKAKTEAAPKPTSKHSACEIQTRCVWRTPRLTWDVEAPVRPVRAEGLEARILEALEERGPQTKEALGMALEVEKRALVGALNGLMLARAIAIEGGAYQARGRG